MKTSWNWILGILSNGLELLNWRARRKDRKERKENAEAPVQAAEEMRQAVAAGDEQEVNLKLEESRLHRMHGGIRKGVSIVLLCLGLGAASLDAGCVRLPRKAPIVFSADRYCTKMELNGVAGWFVPEAEFADLTAAYRAESVRMRLREEAMEAANGDF